MVQNTLWYKMWHSPQIGPMWSEVGTIHLRKGENRLNVRMLEADAHIDNIFLGLWPPLTNATATTSVKTSGRACTTSSFHSSTPESFFRKSGFAKSAKVDYFADKMLILKIIAVVLAIAGIVGSILPALPGPPLGWVGMLCVFLSKAGAESLNSKMKSFCAQLRGVSDLPFFMFRLSKIFG